MVTKTVQKLPDNKKQNVLDLFIKHALKLAETHPKVLLRFLID